MHPVADLLFEARMLKQIPRTGYPFLGAGAENVAEHSFLTTFIAYVMAKTVSEVNALKLISMCLVHDLPEARIGDLNYVNKLYGKLNEAQAVVDCTGNLPFGQDMADLIAEFNQGETLEARLAYDADQLSFVVDLKALVDIGYIPPRRWLRSVVKRLKTDTGKSMAEEIMQTDQDAWWLKNLVDSSAGKQ